ncbi:MAG: hypothetical protein JWM56_581 [Candidatus Peribacteria bacterium]|nr:hypothetical protein [Candidatus Peribacteria bacterium]
MADTTPPKAKDTVRQRKKGALTSTQRFLPIAEIRNDTVLLKNGGLRAVLQVEALNFSLKSETEQTGIIAGYESFMNTLNFPIQIVIRSSKINIDPYLAELRAMSSKHTNPLLRDQTLSYADFVEKLVDVADIMQKRFFVVIPLDATIRKKTMLEQFFGFLSPDDSTAKAGQRQKDFGSHSNQLKDRVNLIQTGLENIGLQSKRLDTQELVQLYYQIFNPQTSQEQKLGTAEAMKIEKNVL